MKLLEKIKINRKLKKINTILDIDHKDNEVTQLIATLIIHADENTVTLLRYVEYDNDGNGDFEISSRVVFNVKDFNDVIKRLLPLNIVIDVCDETDFKIKGSLKEYDYYKHIDTKILEKNNINIVKIN